MIGTSCATTPAPAAATPPKRSIMSTLLPPPLPLTQQVVSHDPQLIDLVAKKHSHLLVQPVPVTPNDHKASVGVVQETVVTEVKEELSDTLIIPASPPMDSLWDDITEISSFCDSPPLFSSPFKQPVASSTQVDNTDCEKKELHLTGSHEAEAVHITETVKQEKCYTVAPLSTQGIMLQANQTVTNQTGSIVNTTTDESTTGQQRHSLRKRTQTHKMAANIRHAKKRQYGV